MTFTKNQLYAFAVIAGAAALLIAGNSIFSEWKIARLQKELNAKIARAEDSEKRAADLEKHTEATREKIEYIEQNLLKIKEIAKYQDENLEKIAAAANNARVDVEHFRSIRTIAATADELCAKLAELGHACD